MHTTTAKVITAILVLIVSIPGVVFIINKHNRIGDVEGKPYSIKLTSSTAFGTGDWVYYDKAGEEKPLNCTRSLVRITCESENNEVVFTTTVGGTNRNLTFPTIKINEQEATIECATHYNSADCLTTIE